MPSTVSVFRFDKLQPKSSVFSLRGYNQENLVFVNAIQILDRHFKNLSTWRLQFIRADCPSQGTKYYTKRMTEFFNSVLHFTILIEIDILWIWGVTYCIAAFRQRTIWMMEGKGKGGMGVGLQMSIHLLYNESNNMGFTYQNPFFHFYWHSPTVYKKYYTRVDQFTS